MMTKLDAKMIGQFRHKTNPYLKLNIYDDGTYNFKGGYLQTDCTPKQVVVHWDTYLFVCPTRNNLQCLMNKLVGTGDFDLYVNDEKFVKEKSIRQLKKMILETKHLIKNSADLK